MTQTSRPWQGTSPGDAGPYSAANWNQLYQYIIGVGGLRSNVGVFLGSGAQPNEGLRVQAQSVPTASIDILSGAALVQGLAYLNTATEAKLIAANSSGNPRIDTVVVRADYALQTARLNVIQGTPAASPSPPAMTQSAGIMWDIPLADVAVANGFVTITNANITPRHEYVNAPPGVYLDSVLNNSGGQLDSGDVVVWDGSADRAVNTSTAIGNPLAAGVWSGRTAAAGYGRVITEGIAYVRTSAAVTRGDILRISTTAKQAVAATSGRIIARALETTSGAGLALCYVRVEQNAEDYVLIQDQKAQNTAGGGFTSGAWRTRDLNTEVIDSGGLAQINTPSTNQVTLQPGTYRAHWSAPAYSTVQNHQTRLRNITDTIDYMGTTEKATTNVQTRSHGMARFRITAAKVFELQHQCNTTTATNGFGLAANFATEVYSVLEFWREGD